MIVSAWIGLVLAASPLDSISPKGPLRTSAMLGHAYFRDASPKKGPYSTPPLDRIASIGNRSILSTAEVKGPGEFGLTFCNDRRSPFKPVGFWVRPSGLEITGPLGEVLARDTLPVSMDPESTYVIRALMYAKGMFLRIEGGGMRREISIPDRMRFQPGKPAIFVASGTILGWEASPVAPYRPLLGAIGDSFTGGLSDGPDSLDYVRTVTKALGQKFEMNAGSGGATTRDDRNRFAFEIAPFKPAIVWIESGTNDVSQSVSAETIISNWMNQIMQVVWGGRILLSTVPPNAGFDGAQNLVRKKVNEWVRGSGFPFVDRDLLLRDPAFPHRLSDAFDNGDKTHINAAGMALVSQEAMRVLKRPDAPPSVRFLNSIPAVDALGRKIPLGFHARLRDKSMDFHILLARPGLYLQP